MIVCVGEWLFLFGLFFGDVVLFVYFDLYFWLGGKCGGLIV